MNDSSILISFKHPDSVMSIKIYTEAGSCGTVKDSLQVVLYPKNIRSKQTLCGGATLRLSPAGAARSREPEVPEQPDDDHAEKLQRD